MITRKKTQSILFQKKLGSLHDKMTRIAHISAWLCEVTQAADLEHCKQAAMLCKADLTTGMVGEFPELQGIMDAIMPLQRPSYRGGSGA